MHFISTYNEKLNNPKCQWSELLQTKSDDPIFEAFLQSGMAKVLVPVRPQYEKAVMWYMETGEIYTGENIIPDTEDDRYASLLKELDMPKPITVEETWQTRVPSSLTLIQEKSTYLIDEDGLPCCDNDNPDAEPVKLIGSEDILLERLNTSASPEPEEGE
jgi:hypothetical protein